MTQQFIPTPLPDGASPVGDSFVSLYASCPHKAYLSYLRPLTEKVEREGLLVEHTTHGIRSKYTADPLIGGDILHVGLEHYYLSGSQDGRDTGEYQIDQAVAALEAQHAKRLHEWVDPDSADQYLATMRQCLVSYHEHFGPGGQQPDYPRTRVFHDANGEPVVEREFWVQLNPDEAEPFYYTCRVDVLMDEDGYLREWQHKTSVPSFVNQTLRGIHSRSQFTGTDFVIKTLFPDTPTHGVRANVLVKGWSPKSKFGAPAQREVTTRTPEQLEAWRVETLATLREFSEGRALWQASVDRGADPETVADEWFPRHGTRNGYCHAFNRECEFFSLCMERGKEDQFLGRFRGRETR